MEGIGVGAKVGGYSGVLQAGPLDVKKVIQRKKTRTVEL